MKAFPPALLPRVSVARRCLPALLLLVLLVAGCAVAPTQEMSDARQSVQAARDAGAEDYAGDNLRTAEDYLEKAERELELRFFSRARHDAIVAKSEALKARDLALAIREAESAIEASKAPRAALEQARRTLGEARQAAAQGHHRKALDLADQARRQAGALP